MDVVGTYKSNFGITLVKSGERWKACCPFHSEKTASFVVYLDGSYYCFGCGIHGEYQTIADNFLLSNLDCSTPEDKTDEKLRKIRVRLEKELRKLLVDVKIETRLTVYKLFDRLWLTVNFLDKDAAFIDNALYIYDNYKKILNTGGVRDR